jgi:hypothetical protein
MGEPCAPMGSGCPAGRGRGLIGSLSCKPVCRGALQPNPFRMALFDWRQFAFISGSNRLFDPVNPVHPVKDWISQTQSLEPKD